MVRAQFSKTLRIALSLQLQIVLALDTALPGIALDLPSPPAYNVRMEDTWIPMKDGVRRAVKLYMPDRAKTGEKFPAALEYHPYRKDDGTAARNYPLFSYFARRGYGVCPRGHPRVWQQ
jgi:predicted acyl esterase